MSTYEISDAQVRTIVATPAGQQYGLTEDEVRSFCTADWPEGDAHQAWLDSAPAEEIADWVIAGRS